MIFVPFVARTLPSFVAMPADRRQSLGKLGEDLACAELRRRGYEILARRYRTRVGEIDIVARDRETIVFVEVKARENARFGGGAAAVVLRKQRRIAQMATDYLCRRRLHNRPCRFDVVSVDFGGGEPRIEVYTHAFASTG